MATKLDTTTLSFATPLYLWVLVVPAVLLVLWSVQIIRRRADARRLRRVRVVPADLPRSRVGRPYLTRLRIPRVK